MSEFLKWLSINPNITLVLLILLSITVLAIIYMVLKAYSEGREIKFWPPTIGHNPAINIDSKESKSNPDSIQADITSIKSENSKKSIIYDQNDFMEIEKQAESEVWLYPAGSLLETKGNDFYDVMIHNLNREIKYTYYVPKSIKKDRYNTLIGNINLLMNELSQETKIKTDPKELIKIIEISTGQLPCTFTILYSKDRNKCKGFAVIEDEYAKAPYWVKLSFSQLKLFIDDNEELDINR